MVLFTQLLGVRAQHIAYYFNFPSLPKGLGLWARKKVFSRLSCVVVPSKAEQEIYREYFALDSVRVECCPWTTDTPKFRPALPLIEGDYVCAVGSQARDYATLFKAMEKLPHVRLVLVCWPENLEGLAVPSNVQVRTRIPRDEAMNIIKFSRFMVLPLAGSEVPCGHVTMVSCMHLARGFVVTNSSGVAEYARDGENCIAVEPFDPAKLADVIQSLWMDREKCEQLGRNGRALAEREFSEASAAKRFQGLLDRVLDEKECERSGS